MNNETESILNRAEEALESIRPHLLTDGGNIEIVELTEDMTLKIKWMGNCETCSMSAMTMKSGVEFTIRNKVPEIKKVEAINGFFEVVEP